MPYDGKRFGEHSRAKLSKLGKEISRTEPKQVAEIIQWKDLQMRKQVK